MKTKFTLLALMVCCFAVAQIPAINQTKVQTQTSSLSTISTKSIELIDEKVETIDKDVKTLEQTITPIDPTVKPIDTRAMETANK